ncbi:MAG: BAX inhibitor (BI)-1/YccA family protein [Epsilonproteobacteria bacterium]|nr:MAG: BAX inhibitor (BI)-1/YccA family protein [Campylobacterota bacterium]
MFNRNISAASVANSPRIQYADRSHMLSFLRATYQLFAGSLLSGATGAYIGLGFAATISSWFWGLVILEFALLFAAFKLKEKPVVNLVVLFAFTFVSGLVLAPLMVNILNMPNGGNIIAQSFLMTSVAFGGISMFALTTKRDFSSMGKMLIISLIVLIVAMVINIFIGSTIVQLAISSVGAILFSAFILYDTQQIVRGAYATPIEAAISLYLDFLNLFISLLQIFGILGSDD